MNRNRESVSNRGIVHLVGQEWLGAFYDCGNRQ